MQITREIDPVGGERDEQTHQSDRVKIYLDGVNLPGQERWSKNLPRRGKFTLSQSKDFQSPPPNQVNLPGVLHVKFLNFRRGKFTWSRATE